MKNNWEGKNNIGIQSNDNFQKDVINKAPADNKNRSQLLWDLVHHYIEAVKLPDGTLPVLSFYVPEEKETHHRSFIKTSESIVKLIIKKSKPLNLNLKRYQQGSLDFFIENSDNTA